MTETQRGFDKCRYVLGNILSNLLSKIVPKIVLLSLELLKKI